MRQVMKRARPKDHTQISVVTLLYKLQQYSPRMLSSLCQASNPKVAKTGSLVSKDWSVEVSTVCRDKAVICRLHGERSSSEKENKMFRTFEYVVSFCFSGTPVMLSRLQRSAPFGQHQESRSKVLFEPGEKKLC